MNIKLIATDLDGTLLNDHKQISKENLKSIQKATDSGIQFIIATGRPLCRPVIEYYKELHLYSKNQYMIGFNGAIIYDIFLGEKIYECGIRGKDVKELKQLAANFSNIYTHIYIDNTVYYEILNPYTSIEEEVNYVEMVKINYETLDDNAKVVKFMMVGEQEVLDQVEKTLSSQIKEKFTILRSMPYFLEFVNKEVNKYHGIQKLANYLNINENHIMTFGDNGNDYHMIKYASLGIAMDNGKEEVKKVAKFVTKNNNESGVSFGIEKFIFQRNK